MMSYLIWNWVDSSPTKTIAPTNPTLTSLTANPDTLRLLLRTQLCRGDRQTTVGSTFFARSPPSPQNQIAPLISTSKGDRSHHTTLKRRSTLSPYSQYVSNDLILGGVALPALQHAGMMDLETESWISRVFQRPSEYPWHLPRSQREWLRKLSAQIEIFFALSSWQKCNIVEQCILGSLWCRLTCEAFSLNRLSGCRLSLNRLFRLFLAFGEGNFSTYYLSNKLKEFEKR